MDRIIATRFVRLVIDIAAKRSIRSVYGFLKSIRRSGHTSTRFSWRFLGHIVRHMGRAFRLSMGLSLSRISQWKGMSGRCTMPEEDNQETRNQIISKSVPVDFWSRVLSFFESSRASCRLRSCVDEDRHCHSEMMCVTEWHLTRRTVADASLILEFWPGPELLILTPKLSNFFSEF